MTVFQMTDASTAHITEFARCALACWAAQLKFRLTAAAGPALPSRWDHTIVKLAPGPFITLDPERCFGVPLASLLRRLGVISEKDAPPEAAT